jgi:hypothetical protein
MSGLLKIAAKALFEEQLSHLNLHVQHGGTDTIKSVAKLLRDAIEKRRTEILAEVMEGSK